MSESQFLESADTGDILLFRGSNTGSKITRAFTGGYFDHVAMILKFESDPGEIYMVEATGNMGVALNKWSLLKMHVGPKKFYKKLVFRHVNFDRNDKMFENLDKFLAEAIGLSYGLSANSIFRRGTVKQINGENNELISEDRTFFCSELVAKAFKLLGIIKDDEVSCTQFYPHHFSGNGESFLKLTEGTSIGSEMQIMMENDSWKDIEQNLLTDFD